MLKKFIVGGIALLSIATGISSAETCAPSYRGSSFFAVEIGYGRIDCYYGDWGKNLYQEKYGEYAPVSSNWRGTVMLGNVMDMRGDVMICEENYKSCIFEIKE